MGKQTKITKSARGQDCQVRIPSVCNGNPETVVLAHLNGGGMGMKMPDYQGAYCCSACHDAIDGRAGVDVVGYKTFDDAVSRVAFQELNKDVLFQMHLEGVIRTQTLLIEQGLLEVK